MDRYEKICCAEKIEGYMLPRPNENKAQTFERAKAECLAAYQRQTECLQHFHMEDMEGMF